MEIRRARLIAAWLLIVPAIFAQDSPFTMKVDVQVVSVDVVVSDANGRLVGDLKKSDFEIYEEGVPQEIRFFSPVSAPYNVFLLFDASGSTRSQWKFMQDAVYKFFDDLRPQDRVAIASFARGYTLHLPWTSDRTKAILALNEITKRRDVMETRFYAAMERTLRREFNKVEGRGAVIVLTDGQDTDYSHEFDQDLRKALRAAREERIPIYVVALGGAEVPGLLPRFREY